MKKEIKETIMENNNTKNKDMSNLLNNTDGESRVIIDSLDEIRDDSSTLVRGSKRKNIEIMNEYLTNKDAVDQNISERLKNYGENVRKLRQNKELSLYGLSCLCGIGITTLQRIEGGISSNLCNYMKISEALKVNINEILKTN